MAEQQEAQTKTQDDQEARSKMCCDGSGRTAEEHRQESADGKCCIDD